jgi:hypothetical protein
VARAVCSERDPTGEAVITPPASITGTGEEIDIESKSVETTVMRIPQVQEVACDRIPPTYIMTVGLPTSQLKDTFAKGAKVLIWCGERDPRGRNDDNETVCSPLRIACRTLLPQLLLLANLGRDIVIAPCRDRHFSEKAEVNTSLLGCGFAKLTRLQALTPKGQTIGHFFFGRCSIMEQSVRLQHVITKRVLDPPHIPI